MIILFRVYKYNRQMRTEATSVCILQGNVRNMPKFVPMENKETTYTPCEQNFERKVNELVKEGEAPDTKQRAKKEAEVKAAFDEHGKSEK